MSIKPTSLGVNKFYPLSICLLLGIFLFSTSVLHAEEQKREYNIPPGPLNQALTQFIETSNVLLAGTVELAKGKKSPGLTGNFTSREALVRLLEGTGLSYEFTDQNTITLQSKLTEKNSPLLQLTPITVVGEKIGRTTEETSPSITIIEGQQAEQPINRDIKSVIRGVPNVFSEDGIQLPAIRGIDGAAGLRQAFTAGTQPRVPILIDGVARPLSNSFAISRSSTWDVSTIEVARGPQPSSTGRNALAGAIRIYTNDPVFEFESALRVKNFSQDGTFEGAAMINVPIVKDQLAFRGTAEVSEGDSFIEVTDSTDFMFDPEDEEFRRYRGKLLFTPVALENLEFNASVDYIENEGPLPGYFDGDPDDYEVSDFAMRSAYEDNDQTTYIGKINYAFSDSVELELRGSFIDNDLVFPDAGVGFGTFSIDLDETETEAFVRFSDIGYFSRGLIGIIHNEATEDGFADSPFLGFSTDGEIDNTGIYAEAEFSLTDTLTLIAGGRYEMDDRERQVEVRGTEVSNGDFDEDEFLPKVGLRYTPSDNLTLGYTYSESFRPGGIDVDLVAGFFGSPTVAIAEFDPEYLDQHEIYTKASFWYNRISIDASAFYYTYDDAQVPGASTTISSSGDALFGNVPEARGYGLEVETEIDFQNGFSMSAAIALLDTKIDDAGPTLTQFEGEELPRAPDYTANFGVRYEHNSGFYGNASMRMIGSTASGLGEPRINNYTLFDLLAGYEMATSIGKLQIDAYIENVTDKRYFTFREESPTITLEAVGRPRTFGVSATVRY